MCSQVSKQTFVESDSLRALHLARMSRITHLDGLASEVIDWLLTGGELVAGVRPSLARRMNGAAVLGTVKARPGSNAVGLMSGATADLDSPCARRPRHFAVGTGESLRRGRTKERDEAKQDACSHRPGHSSRSRSQHAVEGSGKRNGKCVRRRCGIDESSARLSVSRRDDSCRCRFWRRDRRR